jgi:hypothetical protein
MIPIQRLRPESLHKVRFPAHLSVEIDGRERAAFEVNEDRFTVGDR